MWISPATSLERKPILAAFLAIGLGYLVGQINLGGFSLGVAPFFSSVSPSAPLRQGPDRRTDRSHWPGDVPL